MNLFTGNKTSDLYQSLFDITHRSIINLKKYQLVKYESYVCVCVSCCSGEATVCRHNSASLTLVGCLLEEKGIKYSALHLNDENCKGQLDHRTNMVAFSFNSSNTCGTVVMVGVSPPLTDSKEAVRWVFPHRSLFCHTQPVNTSKVLQYTIQFLYRTIQQLTKQIKQQVKSKYECVVLCTWNLMQWHCLNPCDPAGQQQPNYLQEHHHDSQHLQHHHSSGPSETRLLLLLQPAGHQEHVLQNQRQVRVQQLWPWITSEEVKTDNNGLFSHFNEWVPINNMREVQSLTCRVLAGCYFSSNIWLKSCMKQNLCWKKGCQVSSDPHRFKDSKEMSKPVTSRRTCLQKPKILHSCFKILYWSYETLNHEYLRSKSAVFPLNMT